MVSSPLSLWGLFYFTECEAVKCYFTKCEVDAKINVREVSSGARTEAAILS